MSRPRILFMPITAAFEAERFAGFVDWAEIESFDSPGAGARKGEEPAGVQGVVQAALEHLDELGWDRFTLVCDSHAQAAGIELALTRPDRIEVLAIGHAAARYSLGEDRPAIIPAMHDVAEQLLETDYRSFARAVTQMTQGLADERFVEAWIEAVPQRVTQSVLGDLANRQPELVARLQGTSIPTVLGEHRGCVMWTEQSFADAVDALPDAHVVTSDGIPVHDPEFLRILRELQGGKQSS